MRVERFQEDSMQQAMAKVREELGADAVLISSRRVGDRFEVMASSEYDPETLQSEIARHTAAAVEPARKKSDFLFEVLDKQEKERAAAPALQEMQEELGRLRKLFEGELAQLAWRDIGKREPNRLALLSRLEWSGLSRDLAVKIVEKVLPCEDLELAWRRCLRVASLVVKKPAHDPLRDGGVIALVGPTGVGKTTTAAKIAAQFALRHGRNEVALITTDQFRIGGREQLLSLGTALGLPVQIANDAAELKRILDMFSERKLIIIDTAGINPRSDQLQERYHDLLGDIDGVQPYLVLAATAQESVIKETAQTFAPLRPAAAIITKTDENISIGAALSGVIRHRMPVAYLGVGQSVPEDLLRAAPDFFSDKLEEAFEAASEAEQFNVETVSQRKLASA